LAFHSTAACCRIAALSARAPAVGDSKRHGSTESAIHKSSPTFDTEPIGAIAIRGWQSWI